MVRRNSFALKRLLLGLSLALVAIQALKEFASGDKARHLLLAGALVGIVTLLPFPKTAINEGNCRQRGWCFGDSVCLVYGVLPFLLNAFFRPVPWNSLLAEFAVWLTSTAGLFSIFLAPVAEEYFFRGWLLHGQIAVIEQKDVRGASFRSRWLGICYVNALIFWLLHAPMDVPAWRWALAEGKIPVSLGPFFLGLVTCSLTLFSGRLRPAIVFHMLANALGPVWHPLLSSDAVRAIFYG
jgi:membrane protease YdiL (CAAX protease family)